MRFTYRIGGDLKDPSNMREGADVEALTVLNSGKSGGTWASLLAGRGFGLKVEKERAKGRVIAKACSSSSRSCGRWTGSRLFPPNLCDVFTSLDCCLFFF